MTPTPDVQRPRRTQLMGRTLFGFTLLFGVAVIAALLLLFHIARQLDGVEQEESRFYTEKALEERKNASAAMLQSYAIWTGAFEHLNGEVDLHWAFDENNVGPSLYHNNGYEGVFVLSDDRTKYSLLDGKRSGVPFPAVSTFSQDQIITRAREAARQQQGMREYVMFRGVPAILTASAILPGDRDATSVIDSASVLVFIDTLTPAKLTKLGRAFGVKGLQTVEGRPGQDYLPLGTTRHSLVWTAATPGAALLWAVLPPLGIAIAIIGVLMALFIRQAIVHSRELDRNFNSLKQSQQDLQFSEERFRAVAESSSDWIWETDAQYRLLYLSTRFSEITGVAVDDWIGRSIEELMLGDSTNLANWLDGLKDRDSSARSLRCVYRDHISQQRVCRLSASPVYNGEAFGGFRGTASDITDEVAAHAKIQHLSMHDALTGLPNRNGLASYTAEKLAPSIDTDYAVILLDLDHFKPINDNLGHPAGDAVLVEIATRLRASVRDDDLVARLGGDEFVLVLTMPGDKARIDQFCARLVSEVQKDVLFEEHVLNVGTSMGVALASEHGHEMVNLMRLADVALYKAKADGRNTWRYFSPELNSKMEENHRAELLLRRALSKNQFVLHFQPRYKMRNTEIASIEALVRWNHPERGLVGPDDFIGIAEGSDIIVKLGRWVLNEACDTAMQWPQHLVVSVNVSPAQFTRSNIVEDVREALKLSSLPAERLELEITENVMLNDIEGALTTMHALKELGVKLNMDDFGTGYSSLGYLRTYPFDSIKIDKRFIASLARGGNDRTIVQAIIHLGRAMGMTVTAEGVETEDQFEILKSDQCNEVQGFLLSKPIAKEELQFLLRQKPPLRKQA
ncbi:EAL domain-containing protein [Pseudomonas sp. PDM13]|uniref:bifunctional diguanylate cyclase/phosphodiesterase n=1 Tax=Pseudomonas sp. PDM13 TaxID=2769255 RepID=UPI0021E0C4C0|nr:EAL domain-containing protein [Pseudomonas sp. PDM13]MCU9948886.1 EAL domain-containing protein [Pseudomonas sp. PDM13]